MCNVLYGYPYRKASVVKTAGAFVIEERTYTFDTKNNEKYIVKVEKYEHNIYAIKYYLKTHKTWKYKYNVLTYKYDGFKIINTCLNIALCIVKENPSASFGFMASGIYDKATKTMEGKNNNKRYRVYTAKMVRYFSPDSFAHEDNMEKSIYLVLNRRNKTLSLKKKVEAMFSECYEDLEIA